MQPTRPLFRKRESGRVALHGGAAALPGLVAVGTAGVARLAPTLVEEYYARGVYPRIAQVVAGPARLYREAAGSVDLERARPSLAEVLGALVLIIVLVALWRALRRGLGAAAQENARDLRCRLRALLGVVGAELRATTPRAEPGPRGPTGDCRRARGDSVRAARRTRTRPRWRRGCCGRRRDHGGRPRRLAASARARALARRGPIADRRRPGAVVTPRCVRDQWHLQSVHAGVPRRRRSATRGPRIRRVSRDRPRDRLGSRGRSQLPRLACGLAQSIDGTPGSLRTRWRSFTSCERSPSRIGTGWNVCSAR